MYSDEPAPIDERIYRLALQTPGFFEIDEAQRLMAAVASLDPGRSVLEIGAFKGRSTLFGLSALGQGNEWFSVDTFRQGAGCHDHTFTDLHRRIDDQRWRLLPLSLSDAEPHLAGVEFGLAFIDGDHSFLGAAGDLARSCSLLLPGSAVLCHDHSQYFPGICLAVEALVSAGVLEWVALVRTLAHLVIVNQPSWLTDPSLWSVGPS